MAIDSLSLMGVRIARVLTEVAAYRKMESTYVVAPLLLLVRQLWFTDVAGFLTELFDFFY